MTKFIENDSDMPEPLNTQQKQEKRAKKLAADFLNRKARSVRAPNIQGFYSRTRIVTMVGGEKTVIQFRVEPLDTTCFERARSALGEVVPSIHHVEDEDLESLGITTYAMSYMPGDLWFRTPRSQVGRREAIAASLGGILGRGFAQSESSLVVEEYVLPSLHRIRDALENSANALIPHVERLILSAPRLKPLPLWISHFDLNEVNVLVNEEHNVSGIVDWELSRDLPFGMGFHRVCDTMVGEDVQGKLELPPAHDLIEAAFWQAVWDNMPRESLLAVENNQEGFQAAINIGSLFFAFLSEDPSTREPKVRLPSDREMGFLEAVLTYRPPLTRGKDTPFAASYMP